MPKGKIFSLTLKALLLHFLAYLHLPHLLVSSSFSFSSSSLASQAQDWFLSLFSSS